MKQESLSRTLLVAISVVFVCSLLVSSTVSLLRPIQNARKAPQQLRYILLTAGLLQGKDNIQNIASLLEGVETRILDLSRAEFVSDIDAQGYDYRKRFGDPSATATIDKRDDLAQLGRRPNYMPIYWIHNPSSKAKLVMPVYGKGMWSMIFGYIALEQDFNTIAGIYFYEQAETPGIGDRIQDANWLAGWQGKRLYDAKGSLALNISKLLTSDSLLAAHQVDSISGATKTVDGVANLVHYWLGDKGYRPFLEKQRIALQEADE